MSKQKNRPHLIGGKQLLEVLERLEMKRGQMTEKKLSSEIFQTLKDVTLIKNTRGKIEGRQAKVDIDISGKIISGDG